MGQELEL
jgi:hypothetical protein